MKKAIDSNGNRIGSLNGAAIRDIDGRLIYLLDGEDVFAPLEYSDNSLLAFNKGQLSAIGTMSKGKCFADDGLVFQIIE